MPDEVVLVPFKQLRTELRQCVDCPPGPKAAKWRVDKPVCDPPLGGPEHVYFCDKHFDVFLADAQPMGMMVAS